jgi:hypothetical protein
MVVAPGGNNFFRLRPTQKIAGIRWAITEDIFFDPSA